MKKNEFSWDKHVSDASYSSLLERSPTLQAIGGPPSLYSPDRAFLYLSSADVDVAAGNVKELRAMLSYVQEVFKGAIAGRSVNYLKAAKARVDFIELCRLLVEQVEEPERYGDPDDLLLSPDELP